MSITESDNQRIRALGQQQFSLMSDQNGFMCMAKRGKPNVQENYVRINFIFKECDVIRKKGETTALGIRFKNLYSGQVFLDSVCLWFQGSMIPPEATANRPAVGNILDIEQAEHNWAINTDGMRMKDVFDKWVTNASLLHTQYVLELGLYSPTNTSKYAAATIDNDQIRIGNVSQHYRGQLFARLQALTLVPIDMLFRRMGKQ